MSMNVSATGSGVGVTEGSWRGTGDEGRAHHDAGRTEMKAFILVENGFGHEQRPQMSADPETGVKQSTL
jgi:hypothetical protein